MIWAPYMANPKTTPAIQIRSCALRMRGLATGNRRGSRCPPARCGRRRHAPPGPALCRVGGKAGSSHGRTREYPGHAHAMNEPTQSAVAASHVFDGAAVHRDAAVVIEGERISALMPRAELPRGIDVDVLSDGLWLAPGFIDLQVNGGGDVLFNDAPTPEGIAAIAAAHRKFGTTGLLPTLITDTAEKMQAALAAVQTVRGRHPSVLGIHFEGPFLSPDRPGVHSVRHIRAPSAADIDMLTAARAGAMLITLAPERVPAGFIAQLVASGIRVSLGHSAATYQQTRAAMAEGLTGFTHLFNAMPPLH